MFLKGARKRRLSSSRLPWRLASKGSAVSASVATAYAANARVEAPSAGIRILLKQNQALYVRRYISSIIEIANTAALFALGGQFTYQVSPYGEVNAPFVYPALSELSVASSGSTTGQVISSTGLNFTLFDDWLEFDDIPINSASSLITAAIQLQTIFQVINSTAVAKTANVGESAVWEIWEAVLQQ